MAPIDRGPQELLSLIVHVKRWLGNLLRARKLRKQQSTEALRAVVKAVRKTTVYVRHLRDGRKRLRRIESELALLWTELSFAVEEIGLDTLAKRYNTTGREGPTGRSSTTNFCFRRHQKRVDCAAHSHALSEVR